MKEVPGTPSFIAADWHAPASVGAGCSTRVGGHSAPPFDSLNLSAGVADARDAVARNRLAVRSTLGIDAEICWLRQVHGTRVLYAPDALGKTEAAREADGAVSDDPRVACAVTAGDCLPVVFADESGQRFGAVHAGWRGLAAGVIESGLAALAGLGAPASTVHAWLGPCIGATVYEVGEEVRAAFVDQDPTAGDAFVPSPAGRWLADLPALARQRLGRAGVASVSGEPECTLSNAARYFSHRRDGRGGRMAALVWRQRV